MYSTGGGRSLDIVGINVTDANARVAGAATYLAMNGGDEGL